MDASQVAEALNSIKAQEAEEVRTLEERISRARRAIERSEKRLRAIREDYDRLAHELWQEFSGRKPPPSVQPAAGPTALPRRSEGQRIRRGSLNAPLLAMLKEWGVPVLTVADVSDEWNRRHPELPVHRATVRGILDRLEEQGYLEILDHGGAGSANPRQWRLVAPATAGAATPGVQPRVRLPVPPRIGLADNDEMDDEVEEDDEEGG
jgi:hypothetical protein